MKTFSQIPVVFAMVAAALFGPLSTSEAAEAANKQTKLSKEVIKHEDGVRLWVEDNVIGIDKQAQERLFGMFQRLHPSSDYEGTGMGLAIVRRAVERMNGTVGVESEPNQGSRFGVELKAVA